jgi:hypothetical protein
VKLRRIGWPFADRTKKEHPMDEFLKRLKTIRTPTQANPWLEVEYTDYWDFSHFVQFINEFDNPAQLRQERQPFFFRGQSDAQYTLKPKLMRLLEGVPLEEALRYEFDSVCYFRERAHLFCASLVPAKDEFLEWLSLMQHFSAPTRMLDWTSSFTVALYFAACEEPVDVAGAVWLFQTEALMVWMNQKYRDSEARSEDKRRQLFSSCDSFVDFGVNRAQPRLDGYDPDRKSERVTAQRGVFTICDQLLVDHASVMGEALRQMAAAGRSLPLYKIIISREGKKFFRQYLSKLNITAATLFPGTDGLGRTITETIRVHRETFFAE